MKETVSIREDDGIVFKALQDYWMRSVNAALMERLFIFSSKGDPICLAAAEKPNYFYSAFCNILTRISTATITTEYQQITDVHISI